LELTPLLYEENCCLPSVITVAILFEIVCSLLRHPLQLRAEVNIAQLMRN
jgi:hypothetical protein